MNIALFGPTGNAGFACLRVFLKDSRVKKIKAIARRQIDTTVFGDLKEELNKMEVIIHSDFTKFDAIQNSLKDIDACCFMLGVSSTQVRDEAKYREITIDYAIAAANAFIQCGASPSFAFISGMGVKKDGSQMWSRVKYEAEEALMELSKSGGLGSVFCIRPAFIRTEDATEKPSFMGKYVGWPILKLFPSISISSDGFGSAILNLFLNDANEEKNKQQIAVEHSDLLANARDYVTNAQDHRP